MNFGILSQTFQVFLMVSDVHLAARGVKNGQKRQKTRETNIIIIHFNIKKRENL